VTDDSTELPGTDQIPGAIRTVFAQDQPDVVAFGGITEVVEDVRRIYLTPELDVFIEVPQGDPHLVRPTVGTFDTVWLARRQPVTLRILVSETLPGYLEGPISDQRLSGDALHLSLALLRGICGGIPRSSKTPRCCVAPWPWAPRPEPSEPYDPLGGWGL
jgi:hypothetical protein